MFRSDYKHLILQINPSGQLLDSAIKNARQSKKTVKSRFSCWRAPLLAAVAVCICLTCIMPVLAATVEPVYQAMYMLSPGMAQFFMPVHKSDEDNGIQMEVVSAYIHENVVEIYVTMQDLTGDRIDGTTDLYDSYSIHRPFDSAAYCERVAYDDATKTATFLIRIEEWDNKNIAGDKITFSVREFLSHKKVYDNLEIPMDLSAVTAAEKTKTVHPIGGGGMELPEGWDQSPAALVPAGPISGFPVEGIGLTGIGYIDGKLHVQTSVKDPLDNDNHGFLFLRDQAGNQVDPSYSFTFTESAGQSSRIDFYESVFEIPQESIAGYRLFGDFVTSGMKTEGEWRVTFPLEKAR